MSSAARTLRTLRRIARTRYPAFLFGLPLRAGEIPVFTYHDVEPAPFAADLAFLERNGYRTLSMEEFIERQGTARNAREVLLTFDDAHISALHVAVPVLKKFGARAALFVPTYWVRNPKDPKPVGVRFLSWDQVRQCRDSGVFSIESHAHRHALVHVSSHVAGFADLSTIVRYDIFDWPLRNDVARGLPPLGTPVYRAAPLLSARRCYLESPEVTHWCQEFVSDAGGSEFFCSPNASSELRKYHNWCVRRSPGRLMEPGELQQLAASEFDQSQQAFRQHLGFAPKSFAYPWMLGSRASLDYARAAGLVAAFGSALDFRRARRTDLPVRVFGRFKSDWLRLLPGTHRQSFAATLGRKISGFSSGHNLAH